MFKTLIPLLFGLILLAYVFSEPVTTTKNPIRELASHDKKIQSENVPPVEPETPTLEEEIVNNMKTTSHDNQMTPTFQPVLPSTAGASILE